MYTRAGILMPTPKVGKPDLKHLFVVCTPALKNPPQVLVLPISTYRGNNDATCLLYPGDHEFIDKDSYVVYDRYFIKEVTAITDGINEHKLIWKGYFTEESFARILQGIIKSPKSEKPSREFYRLSTR